MLKILKFKTLGINLIIIIFTIIGNFSLNVMADDFAPLVSAGNEPIVLKNDGTVWYWRGEGYGQPSNGIKPITGLSNIIDVSSGSNQAVALKKDGTVWCWTNNHIAFRDEVPTQIKSLNEVKLISAGQSHISVLKDDGTVWCWGFNDRGQLGDGTVENRDTPVQTVGLNNIISISAGDYQTAAIKSDGTVWCWGWGWNDFGGLEDLTTESKHIPVQLQGINNAVAVSTDSDYIAVLKSDGTVWGYGYMGGIESDYPMQVKGLNEIVAISVGRDHVAALKKDGTVWCWGWNGRGNLGDGTTEERSTPVQVKGLVGVTAISVGPSYTIALKSDGTVWCWGSNDFGELGDGTTKDSSTPVQVKGLNLGINSLKLLTQQLNNNSHITAMLINSTLLVNDNTINFSAYNINGNNYFKLRDLAYILNGTESQFDVGWDSEQNIITIDKGSNYNVVGGELSANSLGSQNATTSKTNLVIDGQTVNLEAYNIGGNNYFKLRDLAKQLEFDVDWDSASSSIIINT